MRERPLRRIGGANAARELTVQLARAVSQLREVVGDRSGPPEETGQRLDLTPDERGSERELTLEDAEAVGCDERAEPKPRIVERGKDLGIDELAHRRGELPQVRPVLHQPRRSRRWSSSYSTSAASRPSTASSTLRSCPERWRRDCVSAPMAHLRFPTTSQ